MAGAGEGWVGSAARKEAVPEANTILKVIGRHRKTDGSHLQVLPSSTPCPPASPKPPTLCAPGEHPKSPQVSGSIRSQRARVSGTQEVKE